MPFLTHEEACQAMRLSRDTVRALMADTPDGVRKPWTDAGTGRRRMYRWTPDEKQLFQWLQEVTEWRARRNEEAAGPSAGETRTERTDGAKSRTRGQGTRSSAKSKQPTRKGGGGNRSPAEIRASWNASGST